MWQCGLSRCLAGLAVLGVVTMLGCGPSGPKAPKPVPVSGTVLLDGKPIANIKVSFSSATFVGEGKTNAEGKYELVQGAAPGANTITFATPIEGMNADEGMDEGQLEAAGGLAPGMKAPTKSPLPTGYGDPATSGVTYSVPEGGTNSADFKLQGTGP